MNAPITQQQYLAQWHDSFVSYIGSLLGVIMELTIRPDATGEDKDVLEGIKMMLTSQDIVDVERDLAAGIVKKSTLDKIEKINVDLAITCLAHIPMNPLMKEFWKQMVHIHFSQNRKAEEQRLCTFHIPICKG